MQLKIKRVLDLAMVLILGIPELPAFLLVWLAIRIRLGRAALFSQERPGLHGKPFTVYKFRTMMLATTRDGIPLTDVERIGRLGKLIRKFSLDELPQFYNVLKGEMSFVGPRPLLMEYLDRYSPEQMRRHDVRPGITGLAQVSGRNTLDWDRRFELDVYYVDHYSLLLDFRIVLKSLRNVIAGRDVHVSGAGKTIGKFKGSEKIDHA